jgi:Leucine-rich repeat (LRR) protein
MKKLFPVYPLFLVFFLAFSAFSCKKEGTPVPQPPIAAEVNVPDAKLRNAIKAALNLSAADKITVENILALDTLNIDGGADSIGNISGIADLTGLEAATELTYLHMGNTAVTDLTPLAGLRKVKYLRFNNTGVTSIEAIRQWTSLLYFNANTVTGLTDISPLAGNTGLQEAILRNVPFGNPGMTTIAGLTSLYRLNMRATGVTDITALVSIMNAGGLLNSTPGAAAAGGATLDLRGNTVDCTLLDPYRSQIANLDGC